MSKVLFRSWLSWACVIFFTILLHGQSNRGIIEGIVTDPQGSPVPNVDITVLSVDTNLSFPTKTNGAGYYQVVDLVPGSYRVEVRATGFAALELTDIRVPAGEVIRADARLRLGVTTQTVQVSGEVPLIETGSSNFSTTLEARTIDTLPLEGRDLQQLIYLIPGVVGNGPPGSSFGFNSEFGSFPDPTHLQGTDVSVNGGQGGANAWYLDGNLNLSGMAENIVVNPSPDAVTEFQTITSGYSAEYGRSGGAVFNVVLKSGTNQVHGDLYEYDRNSYFNARNPFTSIGSNGQIIPQDQLRYNDFGGTIGGPVFIPHVYDGRNKTFFFFSSDTSILHLMGNRPFTVPTPMMRQGNFSEDPNAAQYGIWNPYSTIGPNAQGLFQRTAFGTPLVPNGCLNTVVEAGAATGTKTCNFATQLPAGMISPTAQFFMNQFPLPNYNDPLSNCPLAKTGNYQICNNYLGTVGSSQDQNNISLKIDHAWSDKNRFFGEWLNNPGTYNNYRLPWTGATLPISQYGNSNSVGFGSVVPFDFHNQIIAIGNTYTFSPSFINEVRLSYSRQSYTTNPQTGSYPNSVTDLSGVEKELAPLQIPLFPPTPAPSWGINMPSGAYMGFGPAQWVSNMTATESYTLLDNVTKIVGRHTLKTGFIYRLSHAAEYQSDPTDLNFAGQGVNDPTTGLGGGSGLAQFLLGAVMNSTGGNGGNTSFATEAWQPYISWKYFGTYIQDDFHVTPSLTLNLGLRYDIFGDYKTRQHPDARYCFTCANPQTGIDGIVQYEGQPGFPMNSDVVSPNYNDFGPRINFSWAPFGDRKTVFRGGYDIFYSNAFASQTSAQAIENTPGYALDNFWFGSMNPTQCAPLSGQCVAWTLNDTGTNKGLLTTPPATGVLPAQQLSPLYGGVTIDSVLKPPHDPMVQTWSFEIERQLPANFALTVGYVGSHGTHLVGNMWYNFNQVPTNVRQQYQTSLGAVVPITDYYSGSQAALLAQVWGSPNLPRSVLLQPNPFYGTIQTTETFNGNSVYDALDVRLQKRYSYGLTLNVAYTFSKSIQSADTGSLIATVVNPIAFGRSGYVGGAVGAESGQFLGNSYQDTNNIRLDRALAPNDMPNVLNVSGTYELPVGTGRTFLNRKGFVNAILGGWVLAYTFNAESGIPLSISGPCNGITCRPDLVGNPAAVPGGQNASDWINAAAFTPPYGNNPSFWANPNPNSPLWWVLGTAGLRLPDLRSPGFLNLDSTLMKQFHVSEARYFEFRWEVFNTLNHMNLGLPNTGYCLPPTASGATNAVNQAGCQFGRITNIQNDPRAMELALKFFF